MIVLAANKSFMRSKVKKGISVTFDSMIVLVTNKLFMISKVSKALLATFNLMIKVSTSWSKLWNIIDTFDLMKKMNFDLMIVLSISLKHKFWSHKNRSIDLMENTSFDFIKFDLMIICHIFLLFFYSHSNVDSAQKCILKKKNYVMWSGCEWFSFFMMYMYV